MDNTLLIQKYQPIFLDDFHLDKELHNILNALIITDNLNVLFIGDNSSGKTSLLNAVIREYYKNIEPTIYQDNILYINSLKEQGIHYCRTDVRIFCQTCSLVSGKKKIIILDDIDLMNEQSQQVFRICIDKFSHNVHFIASCTNIQKVIDNIQSRLNIIKLRPIRKETLLQLIRNVTKNENIQIEPEVEDFLLNMSNNIVKIIFNYMEKFKLVGEKITYSMAMQLCSNISFFTFQEYTQCIKKKKLEEAIEIIYGIYDKGYSVMDILDNYFQFVKVTDLYTEEQKYNLIPYICKYITIFYNIHEEEIELALFTNNLILNI
jgi:DNA polymerase III delta prime subunit